MSTTYTSIATQTLVSTASSVTFSNISGSYTDLVLVITATGSTSADLILSFNSDTTVANYSTTSLNGSGSSASSNRTTVLPGISLTSNSYLRSTEAMQWNISIQNYSNATTYKTVLSRTGNVPLGRADLATGSWRGTPAAITSLTLTPSPGTLAIGSTFNLYGIAAATAPVAKATGGTITTTSGYTVHTFTSTGTFTPSEDLEVEYLVVAGGGGGYFNGGSAGGAGGFRTNVGGGLLSCSSGTAYTTTVGAGAGTNADGSPSSFNGINTSGGGGASGGGNLGGPGGSGAGGRTNSSGFGGAGNIGGYFPVEGYAGGTAGVDQGGGGGGGAGGVGNNGQDGTGGAGGIGRVSLISGSSVYYAGGGGGNNAAGGTGGGGAGRVGTGAGYDGTANTGGGGGGSRQGSGGNGGSGIVIVRYRN
jgi:hypothetical protein